ncbi:hypothetical protein AKJ16_DCAP02515 [Drosera capensis]
MEVDRAVALAQMKQAILDLESSADNYEDGTLFRFLAARSMEPEKAAKMFVEYQDWKASIVTSGSISEDEVRDHLDDNIIFMGGLTKEGYRLLVCQGSRHRPITDKLKFEKFLIYMLEKVLASVYEGGKETGNEKLVAIVDLRGVSLKNADARAFITGFQVQQITIVNSEDEKRELVEEIGEDVIPVEYGGKAKFVTIQDFAL